MQKFLLYTVLVFCLIFTAGCKNKERIISVDEVKNNTILVKNDGTVQSATVETFDKEYYNLDELKTFITDQIGKYNQTNGQDAIVFGSLDLKDGNAVLILNYSNLEHYKTFNKVDATLTTTVDAKSSNLELPDVYVSASDGAYASPDVALKNDKYKILIVNEKTDVIVDGTVKYFTNAALLSKSNLQTNSEEKSVIVYKP
ncbi:hypothetical protein Ana3638_08605 [Anaerocolumna sedimenticola]|uniref:Uncharacterized protein n=1 Tax=Anaerocolumna sedimenticola TaxID=2696063 RepID=A0A6P1TKZ2_9FIRM|nr:hypothetical protein [Anaerocolumna sedimenticola]QHQ60819.1 hypothetical protein Ana3638_08605 [Anaerocolumna sedimenticola]